MRRVPGFLAAALAVALAAPAAAQADQLITIPGRYFDPPRVTVLAGEPVTWRNDDSINHDVTAAGVFASGPLAPSAAHTAAFETPGTYAFRCTIHAFMAGAVTAVPVLLEAPDGAVLAGEGVRLTGRAPRGTAAVALERSTDGTTWADAGTAVPDTAGAFTAVVRAAAGTSFRAVVPAGTSSVVTPKIAARVSVALRVVRGRHHATVRVNTGAAGAGLIATLETYRRERFTWRARGRAAKLDRRGRAAFRLPASLRGRARVVLASRRGGPALITSRPVRLRDGRPTRSPIPTAPPHNGGHDDRVTPDDPDGDGGGQHGPH